MHIKETNFNKTIFGRNIKALLSENKLKQWQLAEITGISQATICRYAQGSASNPNKINIHAMAHHFKVNIPWLLRGVEPKYAIEEETNSVEYSEHHEESPLYECLEMCREILTLDRKAFFLIHASVAGILRALKLMTQEGIDRLVERRDGERRKITQSVELERRHTERRRLDEVSL